MKIRVIVNPKAGAGSAARKVSEIRHALKIRGVDCDLVETSGPGDATRLARAARLDGMEVLAVVGGDGTLNEISQAYLDESGAPLPGPALAIIPAGTGGDFRKAFDFEKDVATAVTRLLSGATRPLDLGVVELTSDRGEPVRRAFLNIASFGVSGKIDRLVNSSPKWIGGRAAFFLGSVRALSTYRNAPVSIRVDGRPFYEGRIVVAAIANGRFFGGGMHVAPRADPSDGVFDVVAIGDQSFGTSLMMSPQLYAGTHVDHPDVTCGRGVEVEARPLDPNPVYIDTDGETPGRLPLRARIHPGALTQRV
jgi:YegS/Rv2252/BmrU family lipid kinase